MPSFGPLNNVFGEPITPCSRLIRAPFHARYRILARA
jgi:hypothetical protein